jgi:hypothetical protein
MFLKKGYTFARNTLHGLTILGLLIAMAVNVPSVYAAAPANDNFATPTKITTASFAQSISDATQATEEVTDPIISCTGDAGFDSVWYTFTPTSSGEVKINTLNSAYNTVLAIWKDDPLAPGSLIELGCNDDVSPLINLTSSITMPLRGGIKYYIEVVRNSLWIPTPPDALRIAFTYTNKTVAYGLPFPGKVWDSTSGVFTFTATGWQLYPYLGAYNNAIHLSNNRNNTATAFFDGEFIDLTYAVTPQMGEVNIFIDDIYQGTINEGAGLPGLYTWTNPLPLSDNVHKIQLTHFTTGKKANFDTITVYSFSDFIPPDPIIDLDLDGKNTSNVDAVCGDIVSKVTLAWTAPGDDFAVGTATNYQVRYLVDDPGSPPGDPWTPADWAAASPLTSGIPKPAVAGTVQKMTVTGLVPGILYHFNVRAEDEVGNLGDPSNDCSAILYSGTPPIGPGMYDDRHGNWIYNGVWLLSNNTDAYANTQHISNKVDSSALFIFTGTQFVLYYKTGALMGLVDVYIDEVYYDTIDQYSFYAQSRYYPGPILPLGPHSVRFKQATLVTTNIDAIRINNIVDAGPPDPIIDLAAFPGAADGWVDLTWTATGDDPGPPPLGAATRYEIRMSNQPILTDTDWYTAQVVPGIVPLPQPAFAPEAMTVKGLVPDVNYWFAIRAFDDAFFYTDVSNTVSAVATYSGFYSGAGWYEDTDPAWYYYGFWSLATSPWLPTSNHDQHGSTSKGSSAVFYFTGDGFTLTFQKGPALGVLDVYVDGFKVGSINQKLASNLYQQIQTFSGFGAGNHVVQFQYNTGGRVTIDAIDILP